MKIRAEMGRQRAPLCPPEYQVDRVAEIPNTQFAAFLMRPLDRYDFIRSNQIEPHQGTGHDHCLLVLGEGRADGVLVQCGGDGRAAYSAYVAGARNVVQDKLNHAAEFIVQQCAENPGGGSWHAYFNQRPGRGGCGVSFAELETRLRLTIREGSGLDGMLLDTLRRRPEVSAVELDDGCVSVVCDLGLRQDKDAPEEKIDISFSPERAAELLENAVSAALELYRGEDCYSMLHGSFGLTIREIREHGYLSDQELCDICQVPRQVLEGGMRVRDVLQLDGVSESASLTHKDSTVLAPLEDLEKLTASGQEDFAALLDAWVADIRVDDGEPELVLEGIEAKELERFCDALEAHEQAEQAMGDMTP